MDLQPTGTFSDGQGLGVRCRTAQSLEQGQRDAGSDHYRLPDQHQGCRERCLDAVQSHGLCPDRHEPHFVTLTWISHRPEWLGLGPQRPKDASTPRWRSATQSLHSKKLSGWGLCEELLSQFRRSLRARAERSFAERMATIICSIPLTSARRSESPAGSGPWPGPGLSVLPAGSGWLAGMRRPRP